MRIDSAAMLASSARISRNQGTLAKTLQQLSTGKRINKASDDAAAMAMAEELLTQTRGLRQAGSNIQDALSALRISDGGASTTSSLLQRQRELAIQASNDTLSDRDRQALNVEYQNLSEEIDRIAGSTQFNRQKLLDGSSPLSDGTGQIQTGPNAGDQVGLGSMDMTASSLGVGGDISTGQGARAALGTIDQALSTVNERRAELGARINTLQHNYDNNANQEINQATALSMLADLDFAEGVSAKTRAELLTQASIAAQRSLNQTTQAAMGELLS